MRSLTSMALSAAAALLLVTTVHAQQPAPASPPPPLPDYGPNITLDQATAAANAALAEAGRLVYFMKMDNARAAAVELAQHKARTAAMYKLPSKAYEQRLAGGGAGLGVLMLDGVIASAGGIPIQQGGKIIGAIGVGGGPNGDIDSKAAQAGVDAVK
jgi:glc operon protein GlcG